MTTENAVPDYSVADQRVTRRLEVLRQRGWIDAEANSHTSLTFGDDFRLQGYYAYIYPDTGIGYICASMISVPNFILDNTLAHECAHVSKTYYYGGDYTDYHGPLFQKYYHVLPFRRLREALTPICVLFGYCC